MSKGTTGTRFEDWKSEAIRTATDANCRLDDMSMRCSVTTKIESMKHRFVPSTVEVPD